MQSVMALDMSTHSTGVAIFRDKRLIKYTCITAAGSDLIKRINIMVEGILKLYKEYNVTEVIAEEVLPEDVNNSQKTFKALIYLQAAVVMAFDKYKQKVQLVYVNTWRKACGIATGRNITRAKAKALDIEFVAQHYGISANDDICDAICIGWAYLNKDLTTEKEKAKAPVKKKGYSIEITEESAF